MQSVVKNRVAKESQQNLLTLTYLISTSEKEVEENSAVSTELCSELPDTKADSAS